MATVNLGSIKFKWKGTYAGGTAYTIDDVVSYNGSSYICIQASTGNLPTDTAYFEQMSQKGTDGTNGTDLTTTLTTQGDLVYRNASGLARLGAGTSGQILQTNGTGANPSWGTVSSDYVKISTATPSNVSALTMDNLFSTSDGFNSYEVITRILPATDGATLNMRFIDNSGSVKTSADYIWGLFGQEANQASDTNSSQIGANGGDDEMRICGQGGTVDSSINGGARVQMQIINPTIAGYTIQQLQYTMIRGINLDNIMNIVGGGALETTDIVRGIQFYFDSGNIASGEVSVYGRKA